MPKKFDNLSMVGMWYGWGEVMKDKGGKVSAMESSALQTKDISVTS